MWGRNLGDEEVARPPYIRESRPRNSWTVWLIQTQTGRKPEAAAMCGGDRSKVLVNLYKLCVWLVSLDLSYLYPSRLPISFCKENNKVQYFQSMDGSVGVAMGYCCVLLSVPAVCCRTVMWSIGDQCGKGRRHWLLLRSSLFLLGMYPSGSLFGPSDLSYWKLQNFPGFGGELTIDCIPKSLLPCEGPNMRSSPWNGGMTYL